MRWKLKLFNGNLQAAVCIKWTGFNKSGTREWLIDQLATLVLVLKFHKYRCPFCVEGRHSFHLRVCSNWILNRLEYLGSGNYSYLSRSPSLHISFVCTQDLSAEIPSLPLQHCCPCHLSSCPSCPRFCYQYVQISTTTRSCTFFCKLCRLSIPSPVRTNPSKYCHPLSTRGENGKQGDSWKLAQHNLDDV